MKTLHCIPFSFPPENLFCNTIASVVYAIYLSSYNVFDIIYTVISYVFMPSILN